MDSSCSDTEDNSLGVNKHKRKLKFDVDIVQYRKRKLNGNNVDEEYPSDEAKLILSSDCHLSIEKVFDASQLATQLAAVFEQVLQTISKKISMGVQVVALNNHLNTNEAVVVEL